MQVTSSHNPEGVLRVYVNGVLHIAVDMRRVFSVQSWVMTTRSPPMFVIEINSTLGSPHTSDYDRRDLWEAVLGAIDKAYGVARPIVPDPSPTTDGGAR